MRLENNRIMDKFDIKSSTIEKGLEIAKDFVDKLITPSIEETGLLVKDQITMWRFRNQVKMLNKAKEYCEKYKIQPKKISLKVLAPLLDYSGLEEADEMMDKWAILLSNLIDSEQNIENHVFPYLLSQLSKDEFFPLEKVYESRMLRRQEMTLKHEEFKEKTYLDRENLSTKIKTLNQAINEKKKELKGHVWSEEISALESEKYQNKILLNKIEHEESNILLLMVASEKISEDLFKDFELSNLIRLGLVKEIREFYAPNQVLEIPNRNEYDYNYLNVDLDIEMESSVEYILTELGELFFKSCKEKI
jgi:hypothetical protein